MSFKNGERVGVDIKVVSDLWTHKPSVGGSNPPAATCFVVYLTKLVYLIAAVVAIYRLIAL